MTEISKEHRELVRLIVKLTQGRPSAVIDRPLTVKATTRNEAIAAAARELFEYAKELRYEPSVALRTCGHTKDAERYRLPPLPDKRKVNADAGSPTMD